MKNIIGHQSRLKAQNLGLIKLEGEFVKYHHANFRTKLSPEEQVRLNCFLYLVLIKNYPVEWIEFEYKIRLGSSFVRADVVLWKNEQKSDILLILECKRQDCSPKALKEATEQVISYEKQIDSQYLWVSNLDQNIFYRTILQKNGKKNYEEIVDLPSFSTQNLFWRNLLYGFRNVVFRFFGKKFEET